MENFDTIVIGSGAGGLSTAICLARAGQKVLVLEQHYVPGGWCHSFHLNGQRFSPGVHYIGQMEKGSSTSELFEALGIANDLIFFKMNTAAYEHCWIGDERIDMPAGPEQLYNALSKRFPAEKKGLKKYLKVVAQVSKQIYLIPKMNGFWDNVTIPFRTAQLGKYGLFSLKKVIDWHIKDPLLKQVLNVQCGDHGLPPTQASFPLHCAVMDHYIQGGYYPMGGGSAIVKAMTNNIKKHGGEIRVSQSVKRILLETDGKKKRAVGVELENGEIIKADRVVSNADPDKTYLQLIGKENLSKKLLKKLDKTTYSVTSLILFLTVDMDVREAGMDSGNIWMLRDRDLDDLFKEMSADDILTEDDFPAAFISCTTLKDPASFNGRYHNIEVVTFINYAPFAKFEHEDPERSEEYLRYKKRVCEKLLANLEKVLPQVRNHIVQMELGTPITNEFYVNSTNGSVYGTEKNFKQTGPFAFGNKSEIENLYMCGASILAHGVGGATNSGIQTAAKILGCTIDHLLTLQPDQQVRIYDAEDRSQWPSSVFQKMEDKKRNFKEILI
ncbi:MAG TPA: NAD(P)/FAD-dependent oxidoreductase [Ferruginibacter sp.]|jgi:all-trans-retinol 13,14-reductase|nr:NAD(P)/FAD-dependent oxidoreductase [Ferruginibacter sp.]